MPYLCLQQTPKVSPRKEFQAPPEPSQPIQPRAGSPAGEEGQMSIGPVEEALERLLMKSPSRRDSYSDSTDDEEVEEAFSPALEHSSQSWDRSIYQTPSNNLQQGRLSQYESPCELDNTVRSAYYSPNQSISRTDFDRRYCTHRPFDLITKESEV